MSEQKKIYNWQDSQLSIAKYYGGITLGGVRYDIHYEEEGQPLVEFIPKKREKRTTSRPSKKNVLKTAPIEASFALFEEIKHDNT